MPLRQVQLLEQLTFADSAESNDDEIRGQIDDFSDDEDFVTCPPNNNNKVIVVNKANNVESAPQKSNSYSAHSSIQPQRTATASIKLAPSPKVTRKRSKSPPNSNHDNKSNVVRMSRLNPSRANSGNGMRNKQQYPPQPAMNRSISLQASSTVRKQQQQQSSSGPRKPLNTTVTTSRNRHPGSSLNSSSSSLSGSFGSVNNGQLNRSISSDPNLMDPSVAARIGNRATKVVQRSIGKCGSCNKPINEDGCTAFGKVYHKACFKCAVCKQKIQGKFFEKDGKPYCAKDFQSKCTKCGQEIANEGMIKVGDGIAFHSDCFKCAICDKILGDGNFYLVDNNKFVCSDDINQSKLQETCSVCSMPIKGDSVVSNSKVFHPECMKCYICGDSLRGTYFTFQDKPICERDYKRQADKCSQCGECPTGTYYELNGRIYCEGCRGDQADRCPRCHDEIQGKSVSIKSGSFHPECFTCVVCNRNMVNVPFVTDAKQDIYCSDDYNRKKAPKCAYCKKPIAPKEGQTKAPRLRALDKDFHPKCFRCEDCGLALDSKVKGRECYPWKNHVLCLKCNRKKLSSSESEDDEDESDNEE